MRACVLGLVSLLVFGGHAAADTTLSVGTAGDYKPVTRYDSESGEYVGEAIDVIRDFAEAGDYRIEFVRTSWPTLMEDLLAGKFQTAVGGI